MKSLIQKGRKNNIQFHFLESPITSNVQKEEDEVLKHWWSFPLTGDKFNLATYDTGEWSLEFVRNAFEERDYDGILGFSQGSALTQMFLFDCLRCVGSKIPRFIILCGTFEVTPVQWRWTGGLIVQVPVLCISGEKDDLIPPEQSEDCIKRVIYPDNLLIARHAGGHYVPSRSESVQLVIDFILQHRAVIKDESPVSDSDCTSSMEDATKNGFPFSFDRLV